MSYKPTYKKGDWKADCDICGNTYKASELKLTWDKLRVCTKNKCWNPRQPQDFLRGVKDDQSVPWTRTEPEDTEVTILCEGRSAVSGIARAGCAISGNSDTNSVIPSGTFNQGL